MRTEIFRPAKPFPHRFQRVRQAHRLVSDHRVDRQPQDLRNNQLQRRKRHAGENADDKIPDASAQHPAQNSSISGTLFPVFQIPYLQFPFIFKFFHTYPTGFLKFPRLCVGDDAHIVPANKTVFIETFGELDGALWVDVGIDPYGFVDILPQIRNSVSHQSPRQALRTWRSKAPEAPASGQTDPAQ